MKWIEKRTRLQTVASEDEIYCMWRKCLCSSEAAFREYADSQPEEIRNVLWQYAESGRMMQQRLVNLACMYMDFPEKD